MPSDKLIVAVAGMPGSGKSIVVSVASQNGYQVVVMGDEIRKEAMKRNVTPTNESIGRLMLELRRIEGEEAIAKRCIPTIKNTNGMKVIIDGIRSLSEVEEFKKEFNKLALIAIHSSPEARFMRLHDRQRSYDPRSWDIFRERDLRELSVGLGNAIAMAEHLIVNEGKIDSVKNQIKEALAKVEAKWMK